MSGGTVLETEQGTSPEMFSGQRAGWLGEIDPRGKKI